MVKVKTHAEESLGANPADAALNPADSVAMGVPSSRLPPGSRRERLFSALRHREYRLLFCAFLINQTGFWLSHLSMQGLMVKLSENDPFMLGMVFFALFLPAFVCAPIAGVAADRFDRKTIVLICYAAVVLLVSLLAYLTWSQQITSTMLLAIGLFMGIAFAFSGPSNMAIAANSVPAADLPSAVSLQSASNNLTRVTGPVLATPLVANGHYEYAFAGFAGAAALAGALIAAMRLSPYEPEPDEAGIFARMANGFTHARERWPAIPALATVAVLSLFGASHVALLSVHADVVLGDVAHFPTLAAATGFGALIGALASGTLQVGVRSAAIQVFLYGAALAAFGSISSLPLAIGLQMVIGFFYFMVMTTLQTVVQQAVDEAKRGRVMSLFQVAWAGLVPFGSLGMGTVANTIGVQSTLVGTAAVCMGYGVFMALRFSAAEASRSAEA